MDVTVAYPKTLIHNESETLLGKYPEEIHFYVENHSLSSLPESDKDLELWCRDLWMKKEERLRKFYEIKQFDDPDEKTDYNAIAVSEKEMTVTLYQVIAFWNLFLIGTCIALYCAPYFRWFCIIACITYIVIGIRHGGVDNVIYTAVKHHEKKCD